MSTRVVGPLIAPYGVAEENVRMVIAEIRRESSVLATMEQEREVRIVGGMYDVSTGVVRFI